MACHGAGCSLLREEREDLLYVLHGLPSNKVYCAASAGGRLFLGTLAGLAEVEGERVTRVHQADGSPLRANWIMSLLARPEGIVMGSWGGGFQLLDSSGNFHDFEGLGHTLHASPNALAPAGRFVLAGTQEKGVALLDPSTGRGRILRLPLPSRSVQALLADGDTLYVATDNGLALFPRLSELLKERRP